MLTWQCDILGGCYRTGCG